MNAKQKLVENLYKAIDIIILEESTEGIEEIKIRKGKKGWSLTLTTVTRSPIKMNEMIPREFYKDIALRNRKKE